MTTVAELADLVGGELLGDPETVIRSFAGVEEAGEGAITFAAGETHRRTASRCAAAAVVTDAPLEGCAAALVIVADPNLAFARIVHHLTRRRLLDDPGVREGAAVDATATVDASAVIHPNASVMAGAKVGPRTILFPGAFVGEGAEIGADCVVHANAAVMHGVRVGDRVTLHASCVIGSDGFGYATNDRGEHEKIPQVGTVVVEDDVEIGACSTVDRARFAVTRIGRGSKIDNLVQVAHNVDIGAHCIIVSQSGIAGSSTLGHHVVLAGNVGVTGHVNIGDGAQVAAMSGVSKDLPGGQGYLGVPAMPKRDGLRIRSAQRKMPAALARMKELESRLAELESRLGADGEGAGKENGA